MEVVLILVLGIFTLAWALRWLAIKIGAHPTVGSPEVAHGHSRHRNPYLDFSFEGDFYPILNHPDTPRRIEECVANLHRTREHLAEQFGRQTFTADGVEYGYNRQFLQAWKAVCQVARAEYGDVIFRKAMKLAGYREPGSFEVAYDW
jgi:hypothetical protein